MARHSIVRSKHCKLPAQSEFDRHTCASDMFGSAAVGVAAIDHGRNGEIQPVRINAQATAFSVSRKHVSTMLRDAEAQHLLARGGLANDEVTILPRSRDALEMLFATMFLYLAQCAEDGLRAAVMPNRTILAAV
jgi:hypothetical protein